MTVVKSLRIVGSEVMPDEMFINELNSNNPKDGKANIEVLDGTLLEINIYPKNLPVE